MEDYSLSAYCGDEPASYAEASVSDEAEQWWEAMQEELGTEDQEETQRDIERYKASLVARGFTQEQCVDFYQTFSPVARFDTITAFLSIAANKKYELGQFNVQTTFLYDKLMEEVYMHQMVAIYVDDCIIVGDKDKIQEFLSRLNKEFKITTGTSETFLGMQIVKMENHSIFVH
ncbi:hypothetical protein PR048_009436 [Dryococelus australis]|uniref:Reverse transcriptase Ty1/copia-type domain-containing protein n=1 Tax=Dryococelus australis TaxID=614101 RepID=A0ABQ9HZW7_9NEOP|nr:hypothetical protein PR048_009436 [Dryococelus australis]